ncbi:MAG: hypothetical protein O3C17_16145 [Planctomycetota bacterium]|nr:hypothetical protein [Planctomycetota bacterium]
MSVSIITCPGCKQLILSDTVQCPTCHHVLDEEKAAKITTELPTIVKASNDEISCPDCGEMVRAGLVRCWRCGGFLREEIAQTYQKMLNAPKNVTYSDVAAEQLNLKKGDDSQKKTQPEPQQKQVPQMPIADDDDFQLADGINMISPEMMAIKQKAEARAEAQLQKKSESEEETYGLASKPEADTPAVADASTAQETLPEKSEDTTKPAEAKTEAADSEGQDAAGGEPESKLASTGDALLDIAMEEENEASSRRKTHAQEKSRTKGDRVALKGFLYVYCPNGHQIQVEEKHRGQTGRCPRCKSFFHVPQLDWQAKKNEAKQAEAEAQKESRYKVWQLDAKIHQVDPTKLKLKPGSLQKEFQEADLGFTDESLLIVTHGKQNAGLFAGEKNKKKIDELRAAVQEHLRLDQELLDLPAAGYREYKKEAMENMQVVQPTAAVHESIFAGVPVFGEGLIAVRMPVTEQDKDVKDVLFVSFSLSEFREFGEQVKELFGIEDLGLLQAVPLEDTTLKHKCHYSDRIIESIEATEFHRADPKMELEIVGRKCQSCSLVVSEESRKKEKLGGTAGKGIAKAKCPKCTQKFGDKTLYGYKKPEGETESLDAGGGMKS